MGLLSYLVASLRGIRSMRQRVLRLSTIAVLSALLPVMAATPLARAATPADAELRAAIAGPQRSPDAVRRDAFRHPVQELEFFGLRPDQTVVEIWPSGGYWTEILAPVLRAQGTYDLALPPPKPGTDARQAPILRKLAANQAGYGRVVPTQAGPGHFDIAPPGSADLVLTFRNLHNWMEGGYAPQMLAAFHRALKPGGVLGIEEHRGHREGVQDPKAEDGYVRQDYAIAMIEKAGFKLVASSEINANPKDTANWPQGVWTLPPTLALGAKDRDRYLAIGEADNFVLKFRKS